jgi:hypothetical protein
MRGRTILLAAMLVLVPIGAWADEVEDVGPEGSRLVLLLWKPARLAVQNELS